MWGCEKKGICKVTLVNGWILGGLGESQMSFTADGCSSFRYMGMEKFCAQ